MKAELNKQKYYAIKTMQNSSNNRKKIRSNESKLNMPITVIEKISNNKNLTNRETRSSRSLGRQIGISRMWLKKKWLEREFINIKNVYLFDSNKKYR